MYSLRIRTLCSLLRPVSLFADIGCDHGYCSEYMLKNGLCRRAIVTDVSADCLQKAVTLLQEYVRKGVCTPLCTDGLAGVDRDVDLVLIAGMGGMEMVHILTSEEGFLPKRFVLQPMRDSVEVRKTLLSRGAVIERDFTFFDGKYYDVITGMGCPDTGMDKGTLCYAAADYTAAEIAFGRENIRERGEDFLSFLREEIAKRKRILQRELQDTSRRKTEEKIRYLEGVLQGEIK